MINKLIINKSKFVYAFIYIGSEWEWNANLSGEFCRCVDLYFFTPVFCHYSFWMQPDTNSLFYCSGCIRLIPSDWLIGYHQWTTVHILIIFEITQGTRRETLIYLSLSNVESLIRFFFFHFFINIILVHI